MDLSIVVPCCNEADNVPKLRQELFATATALSAARSVELVVVDDGSTDGTWQALQTAFGSVQAGPVAVRFERHPTNYGVGRALRTGFTAARGDIIATTDSDGTYKFDSLPTLLSYLTADVDFVTASPYHPGGEVVGVPAYRLILSRGSSAIYRVLTDWHVHTYTCLFRAYRRKVIESVPFESNGFLASSELMVKAMLMGFRVAEYPTALHTRVRGASKVKIMRTIGAHLGFQRRVLLHRLHLKPLVSPRPLNGGRTWMPPDVSSAGGKPE